MRNILTIRQVETLQLLADGKNCIEAADALDIAYETARKHVKFAMNRLGVNTQAAAVAAALRRGIII